MFAESVYSLVICDMGIGYYIKNLISTNDELISQVNVDDVILKKTDLIFACNKSLPTQASETFLKGLQKFCENLNDAYSISKRH